MSNYKWIFTFMLQLGFMVTFDFVDKNIALDLPFICIVYSYDKTSIGLHFINYLK